MQCSCECEKRLFLQLRDEFGKAEISQLYLFVPQKNVGWFDIPVKNAFFFEISTARNQLFGETDNFEIVYLDFVLFNVLMQGSKG